MKKKYKYNIYISRLGGEHTIGTIPIKVAKYWLEKGEDAFENYMLCDPFDDEKEELNKSIPKEFQINEYWHDMEDIEHTNGAEYASSNYLYVHEYKEHNGTFHHQGKEILTYPIDDITIDSISDPVADATDEDGEIANGDEVIVYGQSFEKGSWEYETIETDEPFDISKLTVSVTIWDNLKIVDSINYDGECYGNMGGSSWGKSMAFWIDD